MSVYKTYTPLKLGEAYRTYANIKDGLYKIYLDEGVKREFTDDTLPNEIKVIVGLINAYDWEKIHYKTGYNQAVDLPEETYEIIWAFDTDNYPPVLMDIGWRFMNNYCLVLPTPLFQELRGGMTMSE